MLPATSQSPSGKGGPGSQGGRGSGVEKGERGGLESGKSPDNGQESGTCSRLLNYL